MGYTQYVVVYKLRSINITMKQNVCRQPRITFLLHDPPFYIHFNFYVVHFW